ncbi:MAG TPA: hypothetical protein VGD27_03975 [Longimicrobiales bacterium]
MQLYFAVSEADFLRADSLYRKMPPPRQDTMQYRLLHAYQTNDVGKQEEYYRAYQKNNDVNVARAGYGLLHDLENPQAARRFVELSQADNRTPEAKARGQVLLSDIEMEQGRMRAALERVRRTNVPYRTRIYTEYANTPLSRISREQLEAMRAEVLALDSVPDSKSDRPGDQLRPHIRLYRAAVLSCRTGDFAAAAQYAQRLRALETPAHWQESIALLATEIDAQIDIENGRPQEGLRKLDQHRNIIALDLVGPFSWGSTIPMWRAEALFRAQRYDEAAQWFDNLEDATYSDIPHVAYILLRKAQIADARNDSEKARDLYARFLKLWNQPDPELQPVVDQARNRLAALQARVG